VGSGALVHAPPPPSPTPRAIEMPNAAEHVTERPARDGQNPGLTLRNCEKGYWLGQMDTTWESYGDGRKSKRDMENLGRSGAWDSALGGWDRD
jgi:hypothetical protein